MRTEQARRLREQRARELLDEILEQMGGDLRAVFILHEFEQMSMAEIAVSLEIPPGTVASRLRRARAEFRERAAVLERATRAAMPNSGGAK